MTWVTQYAVESSTGTGATDRKGHPVRRIEERRNIFEVGDDLPSHEAAAEAVTLAQPRTVTSQRLAWLWAQVFPTTPQRVEHLGNLVLGGR